MTAHQAVRVNRPRGEVSPDALRRILKLKSEAESGQRALEAQVAVELEAGASLNELSRLTGIAKTTLIRWANK